MHRFDSIVKTIAGCRKPLIALWVHPFMGAVCIACDTDIQADLDIYGVTTSDISRHMKQVSLDRYFTLESVPIYLTNSCYQY